MASTSAKVRAQRKMSINNVSVKSKYNVQHRSDLLMDEHVRNVRQVQYELQSALQELEFAKGKDEVERIRSEVADLKAQSQKLVLALQVMEKINTELAFARCDLNDALHKGLGDINAARKRVIWLEDKMGELCGKKRLKTRRPSHRFVTDPTYGWDTDSEGEQTRRMRPLDSTERMYASDQARHQSLTQLLGSEIGFTSDSENIMSRQVGFQDVSSQSYDSQEISGPHSRTGHKGVTSSQEDVSLSGRDGLVSTRIVDHRRSLHDSMASLTSGGHAEIAEESGSEKFSTVREVSVVGGSPYRPGYTSGEEDESPREDGSQEDYNQDLRRSSEDYEDEEDIMRQQEEEEEEEEEEDEEEEGEAVNAVYYRADGGDTPVSAGSGRGGEEEEDEEQEEDREEEEEEDDEVKEADENEGDEKEKEEVGEKAVSRDKVREGVRKDSTFLTEVTDREASTVTQMLDNEEEAHRDLGAEYWQSEHHRFEYSEFADIFTEINPLSYHQVGLAVPGSFIKREDTESEFKELPWRTRRTGSDIKDIHRLALDKLAGRVHGLYGKVYDAAMLSVRPGNQTSDAMRREASVFQSLDGGLAKPGSSSSKSSVPQTAPASLRQKTEDKISLPVGSEVKRGGTFVAGRLIFYPKPIPPPQVLPITRTSLNKEYPQFASSFSNPDPDERKPAERLVDQRNLLEETKLVLYREKIQPSTPGPARLERKFRKMIERDRAISTKSSKSKMSKASGKKLITGFKTAAVMAKFQAGVSSWNQIKPQSRGKEYFGLRWERVKTIVHMNLVSERVEERIHAAKQLGLLRCGDTMVFYALKERLHQDSVDRVKYEAAKSLVLIGCWEDEVLQYILKYLVLGNTEIRTDLIQTLTDGKNAQYVDKTIPSFVELVKVLSHFCRNPDPDDIIAFNSAVCLGRLCVRDESAQNRLVKAMEESKDNHVRAKALEILVKQLNCIDQNIVEHVLELLCDSPVWKFRALACRLLIALGPKHACISSNSDEIYKLLENKLWDDPNMEVRLSAAKALTALGMFVKACETVERKLEDAEEDARAQAAISVGTLGMKSEKLIRLLLEMLELDSSDYVRLMIIRTFGMLKLTDRRVLRCLKEREKLEGALARESRKALKILEPLMTSKSVPNHKYLHSRRVLSPILASAVG
ncbi:uncharacterized protein LOC101845258 [Aplysia californica]|uniref:Uncharacterized protein LOC101845258 n=1 Tax=Aplysia californica TaxID=6500 RepID=A0ABM1VY37_APLCA|nr:uncharacterized protein LOC101845258 [Aplysia californica]